MYSTRTIKVKTVKQFKTKQKNTHFKWEKNNNCAFVVQILMCVRFFFIRGTCEYLPRATLKITTEKKEKCVDTF